MRKYLLAALLLTISSLSFASAPENFEYNGSKAVFIDITNVQVDYVFDVENEEVRAEASVTFNMPESGFPIFDLVPDVTKVSLFNQVLDKNLVKTIKDPDNESKFRILEVLIQPSQNNILKLSYKITDSDLVDFGNNDVKIGFFMSDLDNREFFEQYGPTNFEYDQMKFNFNVEVVGTDSEHMVFTNANLNKVGFNKWTLEFPEYYTSSSVYFHLAEKGRFVVKEDVYEGIEKSIPLTIYSTSSSRVRSAMKKSKEVLKELEEDYGPYAHESFVAYITSGGGGMEYCGATMTSMWALAHEITHSWFARGVMPTRANSGWVDEAIASWRDNKYPQANGMPNRSAVNLGGFSQYQRDTTRAAYTKGAKLMSELDYIFAQNSRVGLKPVLKYFYTKRANNVFTMDFFEGLIVESASGSDFSTGFTMGVDYESMFARYVYGNQTVNFTLNASDDIVEEEKLSKVQMISKHPRPFTKEEIKRFR